MKNYLLALVAALFLAGPATAAKKEPSAAAQAVQEAAAAEVAKVADDSDDADAAKEAVLAEGAEAAEDVEAAAIADAGAIADASEADPQYKTKLICKREKPIGSKRIRKTCYTRAQLDEQSRRTQDAMHRRSQRSGCPDCGGSGGGG